MIFNPNSTCLKKGFYGFEIYGSKQKYNKKYINITLNGKNVCKIVYIFLHISFFRYFHVVLTLCIFKILNMANLRYIYL